MSATDLTVPTGFSLEGSLEIFLKRPRDSGLVNEKVNYSIILTCKIPTII